MRKELLISLFSAALFFSCSSEKVSWPDPTIESKPWTRWWWMGNAVDRSNIKRELNEMANAGIGGIEITSIYGVKGEENRYIEYLSPGFSDILKFTMDEAHKLGMGVDLTPGAGWACGGPYVPEEKGLMKLSVRSFTLNARETWNPQDGMAGIAAMSFVGEDEKPVVLIPGEPFIAPAHGKVYIAERVKTGEKVHVPSPGGEGLAINTFDEEITNWYVDEFWKRLGIGNGLARCFFHDSFEYKGDFSIHFFDEFKKRRGYDLVRYLHVLAGDCSQEEVVARVKSDYRETISDLVLESFIKPFTGWAHQNKSLFRNQASGSPGNILDVFAACDIPETEIFGPVAPGIPVGYRYYRAVESGKPAVFTNKFASSAAHVTGKRLVSSESYTWLNEHWNVTTSDMVRSTNRLFLAGVNHIFFHGTCYSPEDAEWPGWLFFASTQINNRNPLWRELPPLFKYIERCQSILQNATPQTDLLVYWPFYDLTASEISANKYNYTNIDRGDSASWFKDFPVAPLSEKLMDTGYTFDYISDRQLLDCRISNREIVTSSGMTYQAVVVPKTKYIPVETMQQFEKFINEGGKVYFDEHLPESVPGMFQLPIREQKLEEIKESISKSKWIGNVFELLSKSDVLSENSLSEKEFYFIKMKRNNKNWYMVFNCKPEPLDEWVTLNSPAKSYLFINPMNSEINQAQMKGDSVHIRLEPEQALFIKCSAKKSDAPMFAYTDPNTEAEEIKGTWNITFVEGGPAFPGDITTQKLDSWTLLGDSEAVRFAGTARYTIKFEWDKKTGSALLNLGEVKDCAQVRLNGITVGSLLGPTFKVKVDNLNEGQNLLEVEVTNVAANRIRDYDIRGVPWKEKFSRFYNINYKPFDASGWAIRQAGILGPVTLTPF